MSRRKAMASLLKDGAGLGGTLTAGLVFAVALALVALEWGPLRDADAAVVEALNEAVGDYRWAERSLHFATSLGGSEAAWLLLSVTVVWLLIRRLPRLATYVAVTGLGAWVLSAGHKGSCQQGPAVG